MWNRRTRAPLDTTIPAPSVPKISGNLGRPNGRQDPSRTDASHTPTPAAWSAIRTSLGPGTGTGTVWSLRTEGGPKRSIAAAFIAAGIFGAERGVRIHLAARRWRKVFEHICYGLIQLFLVLLRLAG